MVVGGQRHTPYRYTRANKMALLYRKLGEPQDRFGRVRNISPPPGFDTRTFQPAASIYTDYSIAANMYGVKNS